MGSIIQRSRPRGNCRNCGAPLNPNNERCDYCGTAPEIAKVVDLRPGGSTLFGSTRLEEKPVLKIL